MTVIRIGSDSEYIEIVLPPSYATDGWADAAVEIVVHGFRGMIYPWLEAVDIERFTTELRSLYETLQGEANLLPREEQFTLCLRGTVGGHVQLTGTAWSNARYENKLEFSIEIDQSYLPTPLVELESLMQGTG